MKRKFSTLIILSLLLGVVGCSSYNRTQPLAAAPVPFDANEAVAQSGTATVVWEEPMVDNVDVPPGLDPEGHYYRPAHQAIVEIRQGRWKYYKPGN